MNHQCEDVEQTVNLRCILALGHTGPHLTRGAIEWGEGHYQGLCGLDASLTTAKPKRTAEAIVEFIVKHKDRLSKEEMKMWRLEYERVARDGGPCALSLPSWAAEKVTEEVEKVEKEFGLPSGLIGQMSDPKPDNPFYKDKP